MKRLTIRLCGFLFMVALGGALVSCASNSGAGDGLTLEEAIEQAAAEIAGGLSAGTRVAIVAFESESTQLSEYIMDELTFALAGSGMEVAERDNLDYVLKELDLQLSGDFSDESMQSIGKFVGAESVISGELVNTGGRYRFRVNPVNVEKAVRQRGAALYVRNDKAMKNLAAALKSNQNVTRTAGEKPGAVPASVITANAVLANAAPVTPGDYLDRGIRLLKQGEYDSAIADFTEAVRLNPDFVAAYFQRAYTYDDKGNYDRAIADYTQAIKLDPKNAFAYNNRGSAYDDKRDYDSAIADYTQAIRLNPNYALAYNNRAVAYFNKKDYKHALEDADTSLKIQPNDAYTLDTRANAYYGLGDINRAIADWEAALQLDPNTPGSRERLEKAKKARGY